MYQSSHQVFSSSSSSSSSSLLAVGRWCAVTWALGFPPFPPDACVYRLPRMSAVLLWACCGWNAELSSLCCSLFHMESQQMSVLVNVLHSLTSLLPTTRDNVLHASHRPTLTFMCRAVDVVSHQYLCLSLRDKHFLDCHPMQKGLRLLWIFWLVT
jgi:hypothetical protein